MRIRESTRRQHRLAWKQWRDFCSFLGRGERDDVDIDVVRDFTAYIYAQNVIPINTIGAWAGAWRERTGTKISKIAPGCIEEAKLMSARLKEWRHDTLGWDTRYKAHPCRPIILRAWVERRLGKEWSAREVRDGAMAMLICVMMARGGAVAEARVCDVTPDHFYEWKPKAGKRGEGRKHGWFGGEGWANPHTWLGALQIVRRRQGASEASPLFVKEGGEPLLVDDIGVVLQGMVEELDEREKRMWRASGTKMTAHSGRRGGAMAAMDGGMDKVTFATIGNWKGDDVYEYTVGEHITFTPKSPTPHHVLFRIGDQRADTLYPRTKDTELKVGLSEEDGGVGASYETG